jgi:hypothetical protein
VFNWISSVSGGPPVRVTNEVNASEHGGSWSPDGKSFMYLQELNDRNNVMIAKATGSSWEVTSCLTGSPDCCTTPSASEHTWPGSLLSDLQNAGFSPDRCRVAQDRTLALLLNRQPH